MKVVLPKHILVVMFGIILAGCSPQPTTGELSAGTPILPNTASQEDLEGIQQAALDYIEGWYEGDAERMDRSLHPELIKRKILQDRLSTLGQDDMVELTQSGGGKAFPGDKKNTITILDVYFEIATVKVESAEYIDFLHIGKVDGEWMIINVLWTGKRGLEQGN